MGIYEGFYDAKHIQSTDSDTGEVCWFHWREFNNDTLMLTTFFQIVGGEHDGAKIRKQLWFDGDIGEKGGEKFAWQHLDQMGFRGDNLESVEAFKYGRQMRIKVYINKNGYSKVGWIGESSGGGGASVKGGNMDSGAKKRFAAKVRARRNGRPAPAGASQRGSKPDPSDDLPF